jgi:hypothetical protein
MADSLTLKNWDFGPSSSLELQLKDLQSASCHHHDITNVHTMESTAVFIATVCYNLQENVLSAIAIVQLRRRPLAGAKGFSYCVSTTQMSAPSNQLSGQCCT